MKRLTRNFRHSEFFVSDRYPGLARRAKYTRSSSVDDFLFLLCHLVIQPVRDFVKCPVIITSGYRDKALNDKIDGSSDNSLHMKGMAADFTVDNKYLLYYVFDFIKTHLSGRFGELILYVDKNNKPVNIHVALPKQGEKPYIKKIVRG